MNEHIGRVGPDKERGSLRFAPKLSGSLLSSPLVQIIRQFRRDERGPGEVGSEREAEPVAAADGEWKQHGENHGNGILKVKPVDAFRKAEGSALIVP
jgi:hypothetical protein